MVSSYSPVSKNATRGEPLQVAGIPLLLGRQSIAGWPSGSSIESQDTLAFSALSGVRPMTEVFPLERGRSLRPYDERQGAL
jgi:hypothetical protein